jgi:hypothetical protein
MEIYAENLAEALRMAIAEQSTREMDMGFYKDSALVAGWRETLLALELGREIKIVN